jgi:hypothetical protein
MLTSETDTFPVQLALSCLTLPFLGALLLAENLAKGSIELGKMSEEIFRGDRLPILTFPEPPPGIPD